MASLRAPMTKSLPAGGLNILAMPVVSIRLLRGLPQFPQSKLRPHACGNGGATGEGMRSQLARRMYFFALVCCLR